MRAVAVVLGLSALVAAAGCERRVAGGSTDGARVFAEACARCHGPNGKPAEAEVIRLGVKDLTLPELQERLSDGDIANQIHHGSKNQNMPSFAGVLTDAQVAAVIAHVRPLLAAAGP